MFLQRLLDVVKHAEGWSPFSGWPSTEREVRATFEQIRVCVYACAGVWACVYVAVWMCVCIFEHQRDGRHKKDLSSHLLTLGSVRPTRRSVCFVLFSFFWGGVRGRVRPTPLFFFCVSSSSLHPSPLLFLFSLFIRSIKTEEELFCARKHRLRACVLFCCHFFFTK